MKKLITFLMLLTLFGVSSVWADEVETFDYTTLTTASTTQNGITVALSKGGHSNSGYWQISDTDGSITVSTPNAVITNVAITYTEDKPDRTGGGSSVNIDKGDGNYIYSNKVGTWSNATAQNIVKLDFIDKARITKVVVTTSTAALNELTTFELNPNDVYKYDKENYKQATKTAINSFAFPYDNASPWLRLKLNLDKTYSEAGYEFTDTYFTIESSSEESVISTTGYTVDKAADNRVYLCGVKMLKPGTSTLTFRFKGTSTYAPKECQATITVTKPVPTLTVAANVGSISDDRAQAEAGHEYTLTPTLMIGETDVTDKFDVTYTIENVDNYSNSASVTGANLYAGKTTGKFNVSAVATPKSNYTDSYDGTSTIVGFDVNVAGDTGSSDDIFSVTNFRYNNYANSYGVNQTSNKLDRTLKGFVYTFTDGTNENTGDAVKYNNNNVLTFKANGHMGINEATSDQGKCTIYRIKMTYTATSDVTLLTNLSTNGSETITLSAGNNKTIELSNVDRSWFAMTNTSSNNFTVSAIEILYTNSSLDQTKVTPTLSFAENSKSIEVAASENSPELTTTPKTFAITYSSSNEAVATVDAYGVVTGVAAGEATITATGVSNDYFNEATDSYTLTVTDPSAPVYTKWDFTTLDVTNTIDEQWIKPSSKNYYENQFTTEVSGNFATYAATSTSQLYELSFGRQGDKVKVGSFRLFEDHMGFNSSNTIIRVPTNNESGEHNVYVTISGGTLGFENATLQGDASATSITISSDPQRICLNVADGISYVDLIFVDKPNLYKIEVEKDSKVLLSEFRPMGGQNYSRTNTSGTEVINDYVIYFQPDNAITSDDLSNITVTSSDNSVLDVASVTKSIATTNKITLSNIKLGEGGTATLNVAFEGNSGYKPASTTTPTFIVMAPGPYQVAMSDVQIQAGNRGVMEPIITDKNGTAIKITDSGVSRLDDEDESFDYTKYFDFTFSCPENNDGVSMPSAKDPTVVTTANIVSEGNGVVIGVTATPKAAYTSFFTNGTASTQATVKVVKKQGSPQINFWKDAAMTQAPVENTDYTLEGSTSVFEDIKNGRLFYMSPKNEGDEIWFSYSVGSEAPDVYRPSDGKPVKKSGKGLYQYRNGFPVHIDDATTGTVYANFLAFTPVMDSSGKTTYVDNGSPVKAKFIITADGPRPDVLTYSPATTDNNPTVMNTALSVTANGTVSSGNKVYAKFSSKGTNYTTEQLINEANVISGIEKTGVFSTEVNNRKITGVQIYHNTGDGYDYVSKQSDDVYYYEYATTLVFNTATEYANINQSDKIQHVVTSVKYYNKDEKTNIEELEAGSVTYTFEGDVPTGTTIDSSTGEVTIGSAAGKVVVVATYNNTSHYTVNSRTSEMATATGKYTIIISDPNQYLPVITPGAQNFSTTLNVTVKADNTSGYDAYYLVVTDGSTPSAAQIVDANNKVTAGNSVNDIAISTNAVVYAVTYNSNTDGNNTTYTSAIVSETYTKVDPIPTPTFNPDGTISGGYNYVTPTLKVEAFTQTEGAQVYYTLNGQDPVIGSDYTYVYDGLAGIQIGDNATTTIKAIAVKDGVYSTVTTSVYHHTNIAQPTIKVNGTEQADNSSVAITSTTPITISNPTTVPTGYTATIYYTLDGSEPSVDNGIIYTGEFTSPKATTLKAITVFTDESGNILSSEAKTVTLTMSSTNKNLWEAIETTTPGGKLDKNNRTITSVDDITATFGGADNTDFNNYTIDDTSLGTPLDGVGTYSIRSSNDALDETGIMYTHTSSLDSYCETVHEKTFKIPAKGDFVRFEPTKDGNLTIWALQQGAVHFDQDATFCDQFIRRRPVYLVDEQGKSIEASEIESSARLSTKWTTLINNVAANGQNAFVGLNGKQNGVTNNLYTQEESYAIYNMYINYLTKNGVGIGDPIKPFAIHDGTNTISEQGGNLPDNSNDQTGYVLASGGYVKYVFPVKAGKSYYFFGHRTKVGIRGFQFIATESATDVENRTALTINADGTEVEDIVTGNTGKTVKVTLNRNFKANTWTTLVLPFSVSETALQTAFGDGNTRVDVIHFDNITGTDNNTISMKRHWYKMIVAGTPVMIYPRKAVTSVTFNGVQIEANTIDNITGECDDYTMMGTFSYLAGGLLTNDYYMNTSGNFRRFTGTTAAMKATRAWLRPKDTNNAKSLMVSFEDIFSGDDTTGIISIEDGLNENNNSAADDVIYNLQGQKVGKGNTSNLPQGVYIKNGKKIVVE